MTFSIENAFHIEQNRHIHANLETQKCFNKIYKCDFSSPKCNIIESQSIDSIYDAIHFSLTVYRMCLKGEYLAGGLCSK